MMNDESMGLVVRRPSNDISGDEHATTKAKRIKRNTMTTCGFVQSKMPT